MPRKLGVPKRVCCLLRDTRLSYTYASDKGQSIKSVGSVSQANWRPTATALPGNLYLHAGKLPTTKSTARPPATRYTLKVGSKPAPGPTRPSHFGWVGHWF